MHTIKFSSQDVRQAYRAPVLYIESALVMATTTSLDITLTGILPNKLWDCLLSSIEHLGSTKKFLPIIVFQVEGSSEASRNHFDNSH